MYVLYIYIYIYIYRRDLPYQSARSQCLQWNFILRMLTPSPSSVCQLQGRGAPGCVWHGISVRGPVLKRAWHDTHQIIYILNIYIAQIIRGRWRFIRPVYTYYKFVY